jgi:hypothetical protein
MGAPDSGMQAAEQPTEETLLTALRTIKAPERAKHEAVLDYWLSIRGDKEFPPLHDLDPLEISDAGSCSILLELIGGGQDAEIRHLGESLKEGGPVQQIIDAPNPSILSSIAKKLPIVAISRDFLAFEDNFSSADGWTRCWVTLMPLSSCGSWVDYVYAFVSIETGGGKAVKTPEPIEATEAPAQDAPAEEAVAEVAELTPDIAADEPETASDTVLSIGEEPEPAPEEVFELAEAVEASDEPETEEPVELPATKSAPGFGKLLDGFANLAGFYGQGVKADSVVTVDVPAIEAPVIEPPAEEPVAIEPPLELDEPVLPVELDEPAPPAELVAEQPVDEPVEEEAPEVVPEPAQPQPPAPPLEGSLQSKLSEVRATADEARMAQLRATAALHQGVSDAYDFALDAESSPEEYLRLVEAQGLKIQLRAPMAPVVKLAFESSFDPHTIAHLEAVLAWALKQELPRGTLMERIEEAGGIAELLNGASRPS